MMHTFDESEEQIIKPRLFKARIIVLAMLAGELCFCVVALYFRLSGKIGSSLNPMIWPLLVGMFGLMTAGILMVLRIFLWKMLVSEQTLETFLGRFFSHAVILTQAMCEGLAFFCLITVLLGAKLAIMLPIFAAIVLVQLWLFPTRTRFENIYAQAQRMLQQAGME